MLARQSLPSRDQITVRGSKAQAHLIGSSSLRDGYSAVDRSVPRINRNRRQHVLVLSMSLSRNGEDVLESCYLVGGHILLKFHRNLCDISFGSVGLLEYAAGYSRSINSMDERVCRTCGTSVGQWGSETPAFGRSRRLGHG